MLPAEDLFVYVLCADSWQDHRDPVRPGVGLC
jgi:hypothetical protein